MAITPRRNRVSITNLSSRIGRMWSKVFPSSSKSVPGGTDTLVITDNDGSHFTTTINQIGAVSGISQLTSYLSTGLPSASPAGQVIYVSDLAIMAYSNGSNWVS